MANLDLNGKPNIKDLSGGTKFAFETKTGGVAYANLNEAHNATSYRHLGDCRYIIDNANPLGFSVFVYSGLTASANNDINKLIPFAQLLNLSNTSLIPVSVVAFAFPGQSNGSGLAPRTGLSNIYFNSDSRVKSFSYHKGSAGADDSNSDGPAISTYSLGSIGSNGWPIDATDHGITKRIVPSYDNGFGPDVGYVKAWKDDTANAGKELYIFKKDITPPVSTNSSTVAFWNNTLYTQALAEWNSFKSLLAAQGKIPHIDNVFIDLGEGDSDANNANYKTDLLALINRFKADGIYSNDTVIWIVLKERPQYANIRSQQIALASENGFQTIQVSSPTYLSDNVHEDQVTMLRDGAEKYAAAKNIAPTTGNSGFSSGFTNGFK